MPRSIALLGVLLVLGCGDPTGPRPDLTGDWFGTFQDNTLGISEFSWTLKDSNPSVTGSALTAWENLFFVVDYAVTGSHQTPNVNLTMTDPVVSGGTYQGTTQGADSIVGVYTDSSGPHQLIMVRQ